MPSTLRRIRKSLWEYLVRRSGSCQLPWITLGDFNNVLHTEDRIGGMPVTLVEVCDFQVCLDQCGLAELKSSGCKYTWSDNQVHRIFSKIDWAMVG
ncbi:hypothetical protein R3W88_000268 [Solanum pinnatisectum]|uniref:Uncharacterized protein n=1 Tax=Solanum pinnatisectum TaxID=50273 RepID=A0AAV9MEU6_9SOLN|nr:hypothetical protein R3W88_000268 [Solanum pinnatisectum]